MIRAVITEDDFRVAQIHEEYLKHIDQITLVGKATNAKETLKILEETEVDLLLLDVYMPDQLGTDLLHTIREQFLQVDVILITAANDKHFLEKALRYGVEQYLIKPITLERFQETMETYIKKRYMLQSISEVDQDVIDRVFRSNTRTVEKEQLPAGIDYLTLRKVRLAIEGEKEGITSEKVAEKMGASRTTARRYLEYLVGINQAIVEHVYGIVGRPERRYFENK